MYVFLSVSHPQNLPRKGGKKLTKSQPRLHGIGRDGNVAAEANDCNPNGVMSRRGVLVRGGVSWVARVGRGLGRSVSHFLLRVNQVFMAGCHPKKETVWKCGTCAFRKHDQKLMK